MPAAAKTSSSRADAFRPAGLSDREIKAHKGEYALIAAGAIDSFHPSSKDALMEACRKYLKSQFSIRLV